MADGEALNAAALEVRGLDKNFGTVQVLKDVSLSMQDGDFLVLVGPSGCGKSTLLNGIAGLETVTADFADFDLVAQLVEHTGSDNFASLTTGGGPMIARLPARTRVEAGDRVHLRADRDTLSCFDPETDLRIG